MKKRTQASIVAAALALALGACADMSPSEKGHDRRAALNEKKGAAGALPICPLPTSSHFPLP